MRDLLAVTSSESQRPFILGWSGGDEWFVAHYLLGNRVAVTR